MKHWRLYLILPMATSLFGCTPEVPVTSSISIDADITTMEVNPELYGINIEEINHGVDGAIYAELIQNRSFEDGVAPINCPVDYYRRQFITPNGYVMPFMKPDSVPGWTTTNKSTFIRPETGEPAREKSGRSLFVMAQPDDNTKGGVVAYGYNGIPLDRGEKYNLSFYLKHPYFNEKRMRISLTDSIGKSISDVYELTPSFGWNKYSHTFTANVSTNFGQLRLEADSSMVFWIDVVSLFPQKTWKGRANGQREEVMRAIANISPAFVRFPGGAFAEGYTLGTYPKWHETIGNIADRKHFWGIWEYGTTNGMGYHEYLQMCEDLGAEPLYVINSGVTNQSRRPRYEDITMMNKMVDEALDAIGYANLPTDSVLGQARAKNGHPEPFNLKYIEVGSENYGTEYTKRFNLFKEAINKRYPDVKVMSTSKIKQKARHDWTDSHIYGSDMFMMASSERYSQDNYSRRESHVSIGEFALSSGAEQGSMRAAVAEAVFLLGAENNQDVVRKIAYSPIIANTKFETKRFPLILFNGKNLVLTPSYYVFSLFANNRGSNVLRTETNTYKRPQVSKGRQGIYMFDNSFVFEKSKINGKLISDIEVVSGDWNAENGSIKAVPNRWNHVLSGDKDEYNYDFSTSVCRTKGSNVVEFRVRDNGATDDKQDYVGMAFGGETVDIYRQSGSTRDTLCLPIPLPVKNNEWYDIDIKCNNENIGFYVNGELLKEVPLPPIPSLVVSAAYDDTQKLIILKVVNTTMHEEKTAIDINGLNTDNKVEVVCIAGEALERNTFEQPDKVVPRESKYTFPIGQQRVYSFPPNSVTVMKLKKD